jgi:hypothetical protein
MSANTAASSRHAHASADDEKGSGFEDKLVDQLLRIGDEAREVAAGEKPLTIAQVAKGDGQQQGGRGGAALVANKLLALQQVAPWLTFHVPFDSTRSAYKLLIAELWCKSRKGEKDKACTRPTSTIAWKEYL